MFNAIKDDERENVIAKRHCMEKAAVEKKKPKLIYKYNRNEQQRSKKRMRRSNGERESIFFYYSYVSTNDENGIAEQ